MKKIVVLLLIFVFFYIPHAAFAADNPIVGAIRWDDWYGNLDTTGHATEITLGPSRWHYRVPFFGKIISDTQVSWSYSQAVMDQEIAYAKAGGLTYWAFDLYQPDNHLSDAIKFYLSSTHKNDINFTVIAGPQNFGDDTYGMKPFVSAKKQRLLSMFADPNYQKVLGNRPLIYLFGLYDAWVTDWGGKAMLDDLRTAATQQGLGNPYVVVMEFDSAKARRLQVSLGADAISTYAGANCENGTSFKSLTDGVEGLWNNQKNTGANVIPLVMTGWDRRPRVENSTPWEPPGGDINIYCQQATPKEIADHLSDAISWTNNNPATNPANAIIMYAWNENDEGGWLVPTLTDGSARLDALASLLKPTVSKPGDLNADGKVDIFDYNILVANFGRPYTIFDYNELVTNFGK